METVFAQAIHYLFGTGSLGKFNPYTTRRRSPKEGSPVHGWFITVRVILGDGHLLQLEGALREETW